MNPENITPDTLPYEGGEGAVIDNQGTQAAPSDYMTLTEINSHLGKNFADKDTALKALKDTFSYVGKKVEPDEALIKAQGYMTRAELENELFFRDNPGHAGNKDILSAIAESKKISYAEAAKTESYKKLFDGATEFEKNQSLKSVLSPSPRIQQAIERGKSVIELKQQGRNSDAQREAAKTVIEALGLE